jgi:hypothetical protein
MVLTALVVGIAAHYFVTRAAYRQAVDLTEHAIPSFATSWNRIEAAQPESSQAPQGGAATKKSASGSKATFADLMLRHLGLGATSVDETLRKDLEAAYPAATTPALEVAAHLLRPGVSVACDAEIIQQVREASARQLLGWPGPSDSDLRTIAKFRDRQNGTDVDPGKSAEEVDRICGLWREDMEPPVKVWGVLNARTEPKSSGELAQLILGGDACLPGGNDATSSQAQLQCRMLEALFHGAVDSESVRSARTHINFFWGWERAAVASLAALLFLSIQHLKAQRKPLAEQAADLEAWLRKADDDLSPNRPPGAGQSPGQHAQAIQKGFYDKYGGNQRNSPPYEWRTKQLTVFRDLVDATLESLNASDRTHLEKFVELQTQALARQRALINAYVTAFPAIGLIATLAGLIHALSRASGIVAGQESERFANTEMVTSVLSSSFSTTMLALGFMAIFMVWNLHEEHQEADLLENVHKRLISVFWPGRPSPPNAQAPVAAPSKARASEYS